ncbi:PRC-barrel domain-containing protein [Paenibacillus sp. IB182496]|uniref:PRC-barrel domain-containing protein n=1 Tax=Paenibacillus sabuli TaxID=2772509 RepID=A0A927GQI9_9BACL|nr:PRC-barrel domain-containing protein [Paenibacillus sabuli]MBD2844559.1 PRC-barrel domain-containing protein [Paenibacillus sabuli]
MLKLQSLIGLPMIDQASGRRAGTIQDIWFDEHWQLAGMITRASRWGRRGMTVLRWRHVAACGEDAVLLHEQALEERLPEGEIVRCFHTGLVRLRNLPVMTLGGLQLGRVSDVYFHQDEGTPIVGYELTDGFISDLREGRRWLRIAAYPDQVTLGEDAILVPARAEQDLEQATSNR